MLSEDNIAKRSFRTTIFENTANSVSNKSFTEMKPQILDST